MGLGDMQLKVDLPEDVFVINKAMHRFHGSL